MTDKSLPQEKLLYEYGENSIVWKRKHDESVKLSVYYENLVMDIYPIWTLTSKPTLYIYNFNLQNRNLPSPWHPDYKTSNISTWRRQ